MRQLLAIPPLPEEAEEASRAWAFLDGLRIPRVKQGQPYNPLRPADVSAHLDEVLGCGASERRKVTYDLIFAFEAEWIAVQQKS